MCYYGEMNNLFLILILPALLLGGCSSSQQPHVPLDGSKVVVMPIEGSHGDYATQILIEALEVRNFTVIPDEKVRNIANKLGIRAEHRLFPEGPSIYSRVSQLDIAGALGAVAFFSGKNDAIEISADSLAGAHLYLEFVKADNGTVLWSDQYTPGFWTMAVTARQHVKAGMREFADRFAVYEKPDSD